MCVKGLRSGKPMREYKKRVCVEIFGVRYYYTCSQPKAPLKGPFPAQISALNALLVSKIKK